MTRALSLLIVEDSEDDADLLLRVLQPAGYEPVDLSALVRGWLPNCN